jgi:large subunit ribosomal protein L24
MAHVHRGDNVVVIKGRDRGKRGKVKRVLPNGRVEIEKINMVKRHSRPTQKNPQGGIQDLEGTVALANVMLWCDRCGGPRRTRLQTDENGLKSRACVKCDQGFSNPGM